jgi:phosphatidyl-myo-inositol alpha-mannosyltransferase
MKIALVSPYDLQTPGGVQAHIHQLAATLRAGGDHVEVLGPDRAVQVPFNGSVAPIGLGPTAGRRLRGQLDAMAPDIVHVHEPLVPWVGLAAATSEVAPVVATFHAWSEQRRLYRIARPIGRRVLARLAGMLAVSDAAAAYHADALGVPRGRFTIVPNGVEVARFADATPLANVADPSRPTLLFVGRLEPRKGLVNLVKAFTLLKSRHPDLRLLVVGEGSERERCQSLLPARLRADVLFLGRLGNEDLPGVFAACDLFVSPALGGESFGIVLLEAMAAGRAVVASDIPGYRSVVTDGRQGRLVPPGEPAPLADAIGAMIANPALRDAAATEGRRTVSRYDWPVVAGEVRACYLDAVARG